MQVSNQLNNHSILAVGTIVLFVGITTIVPLFLLLLLGLIIYGEINQRIPHTEYELYLKTDKWKAIRKEVILRDNYTCQYCKSSVKLTTAHCHHLTYKRLRREKLSDLVCLCRNCHILVHSKSPKPKG